MALAACGDDALVEKMRETVHLREDGSFAFDKSFFSYDRYGMIRPFTRKFLDAFGPPRRREDEITDHHRALARALQTVAQEIVVHVVRGLSRSYPSRNLCLTGGVALNCVANARILEETDFQRLWIPPVASDTGVPLGSALWHYHQTLGHERQFRMTHAYWGTEYTNGRIERAFDQAGLRCERLDEGPLISRVAGDLSRDKIVGWFQGRFEVGPRALGNRSILASPLKRDIRDVINQRVKFREPFRPFAPVVLEDRASEFFEISEPDPYMTRAPKVKPEKVRKIPAAVHVDGSARLQTIDRASNPRYYGLIEEFGRLTGAPVLLNTSFNKQEPIVTTPEEAISCYLRTDMDVLAIGDLYSTDRNDHAVARATRTFKLDKANLLDGD